MDNIEIKVISESLQSFFNKVIPGGEETPRPNKRNSSLRRKPFRTPRKAINKRYKEHDRHRNQPSRIDIRLRKIQRGRSLRKIKKCAVQAADIERHFWVAVLVKGEDEILNDIFSTRSIFIVALSRYVYGAMDVSRHKHGFEALIGFLSSGSSPPIRSWFTHALFEPNWKF